MELFDIIAVLITLSVAYCVVVFSILVQGLTLGPVVHAMAKRADVEMERTGLPALLADDDSEPGDAIVEAAGRAEP